jgi:type III secretion system low calcium response chaperone LcrH/SycD
MELIMRATRTVKPRTQYAADAAGLKDLISLRESDVEFLYKLAYNFFGQSRYAEAQPFFALLAMYDAHETRFWLGLGECRQRQSEYNDALAAYSMAIRAGSGDYRPALHMAECLVASAQFEAALQLLDIAKKELGDEAENKTAVVDRIARLRRVANQRKHDALSCDAEDEDFEAADFAGASTADSNQNLND